MRIEVLDEGSSGLCNSLREQGIVTQRHEEDESQEHYTTIQLHALCARQGLILSTKGDITEKCQAVVDVVAQLIQPGCTFTVPDLELSQAVLRWIDIRADADEFTLESANDRDE